MRKLSVDNVEISADVEDKLKRILWYAMDLARTDIADLPIRCEIAWLQGYLGVPDPETLP